MKIVLDSMLYETLKWPQIAPFCISSKKKFPDISLNAYGVHIIKPQLRPWHVIKLQTIFFQFTIAMYHFYRAIKKIRLVDYLSGRI